MKKNLLGCLAFILIIASVFCFASCGELDGTETPSEEELLESGESLSTALPDFTALTDNYTYKEKTQQTNGEDWFNYNYVKLNSGNVLIRNTYINNNSGWQYEDEAFAEYDANEVSYILYTKDSNNDYLKYNTYKYEDTDEDFQKYYYTQGDDFDNNEKVNNYLYDLSFLNYEQFEYKTYIDENNNTIHYWLLKSEYNIDDSFKQSLYDGLNITKTTDIAGVGLYSMIIYVENNKVTKLFVDCNDGASTPQAYKITIQFEYEDYQFDVSTLTEGFTEYILNESFAE
jgi:hypothetical protein